MKNIETKWLEDFLTLEECRNFSKAAELRNISQSAFSRRISSLENALGITLFNRTIIPLQLTAEGKIFHSQARNLLQQFEYNINQLVSRNGELPNIKFSAAHSLSLHIMPQLIKRLVQQQQYFIYSVETIDVDQTVNMLIEGKRDFILSFFDERLMQSPFLALEVLQSYLYPVTLSDEKGFPVFHLPQAPLLNYTATSYMGRLVNRMLGQYPAINPKIKFISSMSELLKNMVLNQQGVAWLPEYSIQQELKAKKLIILNQNELVIPIKAYIYRMNTRLNSQAENFWQKIKLMYQK